MSKFPSSSVFRTSFQVYAKETLQWYPGHMFQSLLVMQHRIKQVDCVLEVHDARVPFSGRNPNFLSKIIGPKPYILILNKKDLITNKQKQNITARLKEQPNLSFLFTNSKDQTCDGLKRVVKLSETLISRTNRYHRFEEVKKRLMVIGIPNVGKSSLINGLRNKNLNKGRANPVGAMAGITKTVMNEVKVSNDPPMYLVDTPGILPPNVVNPEDGMKLALCACLPDANVGMTHIADFLLYWMNKTSNFTYVELFGLEAPSDEIMAILTKMAVDKNKFKRYKNVVTNIMENMPDVDYAAQTMVHCFRSGKLGKILLEDCELDETVKKTQIGLN